MSSSGPALLLADPRQFPAPALFASLPVQAGAPPLSPSCSLALRLTFV